MIEALVTLLVLGLSALAFAALQVKGVTGNTGALYRSKAVQLASEMADRIRANDQGHSRGHYSALTGAPAMPACGTAAACANATVNNDMAQYDYAVWRTALAASLPDGAGVVCSDASPDDGTANAPACDGGGGAAGAAGSYVTIKVFWTEHGGATPNNEPQRVWAVVR